jgi:hypothetical protein
MPLCIALVTRQIAGNHLPVAYAIPLLGIGENLLERGRLYSKRQNETGENQTGELHTPMTPCHGAFGNRKIADR